jgi:hypothetical protein
VRQTFGGQTFGFTCFPLGTGAQATTCAQRIYTSGVIAATIDAQQPVPTVCQPARTTCAGIADLSAATSCDADVDCGETGVADGICHPDLEACTLPCVGGLDCIGNCDVNIEACEL